MRKVAILTKDQSLNPQKQYIEIKKSRKLLQNKPKYELKTQIDRQFDH